MFDRPRFKMEVLKADPPTTEWRVAQALGMHPATFSDYTRGARTPPADFAARVEAVLGLPAGALEHVPGGGTP